MNYVIKCLHSNRGTAWLVFIKRPAWLNPVFSFLSLCTWNPNPSFLSFPLSRFPSSLSSLPPLGFSPAVIFIVCLFLAVLCSASCSVHIHPRSAVLDKPQIQVQSRICLRSVGNSFVQSAPCSRIVSKSSPVFLGCSEEGLSRCHIIHHPIVLSFLFCFHICFWKRKLVWRKFSGIPSVSGTKWMFYLQHDQSSAWTSDWQYKETV